jgi:hypothetical protein
MRTHLAGCRRAPAARASHVRSALLTVTFRTTLWRLGEAELEVDDHAPVTVPLFH